LLLVRPCTWSLKPLIGDLFLWRLLNWSHGQVEDRLERSTTRCKVRYLEQTFGVPSGQGEAAFALVRDTHLQEHTRERFHVQHSEGYLLFITAFVCGVVALLDRADLLSNPVSPGILTVLVTTAVLALGAGIWHDIVLCRAERAAIGALPEAEVRQTLRGGGFQLTVSRVAVDKINGPETAA
jgi:hypothetical protein